jgi:RsiW-degrading membrane proteinase PrsW (M82 family)
VLLALWVSLTAVILPTLAYVLLFYWADRYEREPIWLATVAFFWGAVPAIGISLVAELLIGAPFVVVPGSMSAELVEGVIIAPVVEEIAKALALLWIFYRRRQEFDGVLDGLMYGALLGFGFAMTENFLYFVGAYAEAGFFALSVLIFLRAIVFGLGHAFYTGLTGIGLGLARNRSNPARSLFIFGGLAAAIAVHALHNLGAVLVSVTGWGVVLSLALAVAGFGLTLLATGLAWQHERNVIQNELAGEVGGLITAGEYAWLTGRWRRPENPRDPQSAGREQLLVEYALRKQRLRLRGDGREPELARELEQLRNRLAPSGSIPA